MTQTSLGLVSSSSNRDRNKSFSNQHNATLLAGDLDGFHLRLLLRQLGDSYGQDAILHRCPHLIGLGVLWQAEPPEELAAASLDPVPCLALLLLLDASLSADLKNSSLFHLHLHLLLLEAREVGFEHVGLRRLLPVDLQVREGRQLIVGPEVG
ncbi:hypothetical protein EUGRSUZ_B02741 [Eucalyptus grandis]|uniref:Uncharacterized protein n=2 Tax=Eucalyptus grandis TaxID=71139 RepID=A0ACC3M2I0_EUCGR|nr:hypothetical protein EUGRSUZ_B02741 [Eucalyptus grandis]